MAEIALQLALAVLLLLTITWCMIVHHRLRRLHADSGEMRSLIAALDEATDRAEAAVREMREANMAATTAASEQHRRSRQQCEELARLMDNALRLIKRLDAAVQQGATRVAEFRTTAVRDSGGDGSGEHGGKRAQKEDAASEEVCQGRPRAGSQPRFVRRAGPLNALLHGELQEALQALR